MRKRTRIVAVGVAAGLVAGGSGVAVAETSASSSPSASPAKAACVAISERAKQAAMGKAASGRGWIDVKGLTGGHVSSATLKVALRDSQAASTPQAGLTAPAAVAVFARDLHISTVQAQAFLRSVRVVSSTTGRTALFPQSAVHDFAVRLHISDDRAGRALTQIALLGKAKGGIEPGDSRFMAIARGLGVTPRRFAAALADLKRGGVSAPGCRP